MIVGANNPIINDLNQHLICQIGILDKHHISCFLENADFSLENQFSSPFESANPEGKMPSLMGMIQSGMVTPTISTLVGATDGMMPQFAQNAGETANQVIESTTGIDIKGVATNQLQTWQKRIDSLKGRTSFTKINSEQIYTSSSAVRITGTVVLVAWANARTEVENKLRFLQECATPAYLHDQSVLQSFATNQDDKLQALFPSEIPPVVFVKYGGKTYYPLFIESLSAPITAPMTADGSRIAVKAQITLVSKKAWDRADVVKLYGS